MRLGFEFSQGELLVEVSQALPAGLMSATEHKVKKDERLSENPFAVSPSCCVQFRIAEAIFPHRVVWGWMKGQ